MTCASWGTGYMHSHCTNTHSYQFTCLEYIQAEHHARALKNVPGVSFYSDEKRGRIGMLTTVEVKHAMCTLLNAMLRCVEFLLSIFTIQSHICMLLLHGQRG